LTHRKPRATARLFRIPAGSDDKPSPHKDLRGGDSRPAQNPDVTPPETATMAADRDRPVGWAVPTVLGNRAFGGFRHRGHRAHRDGATACRVGSQPTREAVGRSIEAQRRTGKPRMTRITRMDERRVNGSNSCHGCNSWLKAALVPAAGRQPRASFALQGASGEKGQLRRVSDRSAGNPRRSWFTGASGPFQCLTPKPAETRPGYSRTCVLLSIVAACRTIICPIRSGVK